uniref:Uncharacterized protein n=1 Tax=Anguilla anguilla TaxID=7936 RepID=A0A0E9WH78_ANGAN
MASTPSIKLWLGVVCPFNCIAPRVWHFSGLPTEKKQ